MAKRKKLTTLFKFVQAYKGLFLIGMICLGLSSLPMLVFPYVIGQMVDASIGKADGILTGINELALLLVVVVLAQALFSFIRVYTFSFVTEKNMSHFRKAVFEKVISMPISFFEKEHTGAVISRITNDISMIQDVINTKIAEYFRQMIMVIFGIAALAFINSELTLIMLASFPPVVVAAIFFGRYIRKKSKQAQEEQAKSSTIIEEALSGIRIVKTFTNELLEVGKFKKSQDAVVKVSLAASVRRSLFISLIITTIFGAFIFVLWQGVKLIEAGNLNPGDLTTFLMMTLLIAGSGAGIGEIHGQIQKAIGATDKVFDLLQQTGEHQPTNQTYDRWQEGSITVKDLHFAYPQRPEAKVLHGINFELNPGEKIALVGPSGGGKSTVAQLILGLYPFSEGNILFNKQSFNEFQLEEIRSNIGYVSQDIFLFGSSVRDNIAYGNPLATEAQIKAAADQANATEFIAKFDKGFDTLLGERGLQLSGGQRQRIAIARAILKDPAVLILDEATSALDNQSEKLVQEALNNLMVGRSAIIIAHRLSTIKAVDKIAVINHGQVEETGTHQELMKAGGLYNHLVSLQFENSEEYVGN